MIENWNENRRKITTKRTSTMDISPKYITIMSSKKTLDVPFHCQEESNWCAAAVGQMIADYYGHARCAVGYADSSCLPCLLIYDLWPENIGLIYWESYWVKKHTKDIHVED